MVLAATIKGGYSTKTLLYMTNPATDERECYSTNPYPSGRMGIPPSFWMRTGRLWAFFPASAWERHRCAALWLCDPGLQFPGEVLWKEDAGFRYPPCLSGLWGKKSDPWSVCQQYRSLSLLQILGLPGNRKRQSLPNWKRNLGLP